MKGHCRLAGVGALLAVALPLMGETKAEAIVPLESSVASSASVLDPIEWTGLSQEALTPVVNASTPVAQVIATSQNSIEATVQDFIETVAAGDYAAALNFISPTLQPEVSATSIENAWSTLQSFVGPFQRIVEVRLINAIDFDVAMATLEFGKGTEEIIFVLNDAQEIIAAELPGPELSLEVIAQTFINALVRGDYGEARALLHPQLKVELTPATIQERWETLQQQVGDYKNYRGIQSRNGEDFNVVLIELEFSDFIGNVIVIIDSNGRISGVNMEQI